LVNRKFLENKEELIAWTRNPTMAPNTQILAKIAIFFKMEAFLGLI